MTTRAVEQFDEWESSPFRDGYRGLHDLADSDFSGIVEVGGAKLCMLNGTAVGILGGDIDDFEGASGTAYEAPSPALPLLALMQERSEEVRGKYYSEDTPLSEVDDTLSDGGFTGFIELSENVLSGDYYVVYHRGRSMAVAWVGNSGQLLTDDEAFERADDEVGIFAVHPAELDPVEIPEVDDGDDAAGGADTAAAGGAAPGGAAAADEPETDDVDDAGSEEPATGAEPSDSAPAAETDPAETDPVDAEPTAEPGSADPEPASEEATADTPETGDKRTRDTDGVTDDEPDGGAANAAGADGDAGVDAAATDTGGEPAEGSADRSEPTDRRDRTGRSDDRDRTGGSSDSDRARESGRSGATDADRAGGTGGRAADREEEGRSSSDREADRRERAGRSDERRDRADRTEDRNDAGDGRAPERDSASRSADARTDREPDRESGGRANRDPDAAADRGAGASSGRAESPDRRQRDSTEARTGDARSSESSRDRVRDRGGGAADSPNRSADSGGRAEESRAAGRSADAGGSAGAASSPDQLETHSIPSLDPSRTTTRESDDGGAAGAAPSDGSPEAAAASAIEDRADGPAPSARDPDDRGSGRAEGRNQGAATGSPETRSESAPAEPRTTEAAPAESRANEPDPGRADERVADLEDELAERESEIDRLEADLAAAESERDDLRSQLEDVRAERDDLQSRVERVESERDELERERDGLESEVSDLQSEVERLETQLADIKEEFGAAVDAEQRLSPGEALDQTNLFVRYESKGKPTLETAHAGEASRQEVGENLGLEYHTQFDSATASVGGRPFDEFLRDTMQFRFVTWVINDLLYEIRDTGKVSALQDLYDAIPKIDRAELNGSVTTEYTEDGQERRSQESFDVVMRDRMGNALLTANMNDSRQAASESMMSALVTASSHVGESTESLGASFLVTSSFFEPEALETAADATSGGLLSRDKRESFVKLTRKQGYHLCLVEAREEKFHLAVPEL
ncbi:DUF7527 domain-containing protein [Halosimplex pelagicum]|uniref:DUF7527 domain-containing protein n=1 Tax=Halosimplex pelagicum TaxID=869886 RepID=A0A7D5THC2_9EURY|nr:hypothetical protein [Halosimplex pelagicum]QLH82716.1 hypothetical protein HZS54_14270 [Halosimplex pelagicum]